MLLILILSVFCGAYQLISAPNAVTLNNLIFSLNGNNVNIPAGPNGYESTLSGDILSNADGAEVSISGEVLIQVVNNVLDENDVQQPVYQKINLGLDSGGQAVNQPVVFQPAAAIDNGVGGFAHLVFDVDANVLLEVSLHSDVYFCPTNTAQFNVTFRGRGVVVFNMPNGTSVLFGPKDSVEEATDTLGTVATVLMSQFADADAYNGLKNSVLFRRKAYDQDQTPPSTAGAHDCYIRIGRKSRFQFVSANHIGIGEFIDANQNGLLDVYEDVITGYGTVAFDPTSTGNSRMILDIAPAFKDGSGNRIAGTDGAFLLYGMYVAPSLQVGQQKLVANTDIVNTNGSDGIVTNIDHRYLGGIKARMRIIDQVAYDYYAANSGVSWDDYRADKSKRRGLMVINHNTTFPQLMANYDVRDRFDTTKWSAERVPQTGFVMGTNSELEIGHNLFLDYVADGENRHLSSSYSDVSLLEKQHNPAALIIDSLPLFDHRSPGTVQTADPNGNLAYVLEPLYQGHFPEYGNMPLIFLDGHAGIFVRTTTRKNLPDEIDEDNDAQVAAYYTTAYDAGVLPVITIFDNTIISELLYPIGGYDGNQVQKYASTYPISQRKQIDVGGNHALEIFGDTNIVSRTGADGDTPDGYINIPPIMLDQAGFETTYGDLSGETITLTQAGERPLTRGYFYPTNEMSSILLNADLYLTNCRYIHNDVLRFHPTDFLPALPSIVGGELAVRKSLSGKAGDQPVVHLISSTIECHESFVTAGVRFAVHENVGVGLDADNASTIELYNRGRLLDYNGYGRALMFGSDNNLATYKTNRNALYTHSVLRDSSLHVYRQAVASDLKSTEKNTIMCTLTTPNETNTTGKALHVVYLYGDSFMTLGWPALEADIGYKPWNFSEEILKNLQKSDPNNQYNYRFNPYNKGAQILHVNGDNLYFGASDTNDLPPTVPVLSPADSGVIYVDHGGAFVVSGSHDCMVDTAIARKLASTTEASGVIDLPADQVTFLENGTTQPYGINYDIHAKEEGPFEGFVNMSGNPGTVTLSGGNRPKRIIPVKGVPLISPPEEA